MCYLQSQAFATVAAGIEAVEAGHAAIIRYQLYQVCVYVCLVSDARKLSFQQVHLTRPVVRRLHQAIPDCI